MDMTRMRKHRGIHEMIASAELTRDVTPLAAAVLISSRPALRILLTFGDPPAWIRYHWTHVVIQSCSVRLNCSFSFGIWAANALPCLINAGTIRLPRMARTLAMPR